MRIQPIYFFDENDKIKIEKLPEESETEAFFQKFGLYPGAEALILWKYGKKIILKISENKIAISERAGKIIYASKI